MSEESKKITGLKVPLEFVDSLEECRAKREGLDNTLKVAMNHHRDNVMILTEESNMLWNLIYEHFNLDSPVKKSKYYAIKIGGEWVMAERPIGHPYRIEEE